MTANGADLTVFDESDPTTNELWDVRDVDGALLGRTMRRGLNRFEPGEYHLVVGTCVQAPDGRVLVTRRSPDKKTHPNKWEFSAGSALTGEESAEAAARELGEETGIVVPPEALTFVGRVLERKKLFDVYFLRLREPVTIVPQEGEVSEFAWHDVATAFDADGPIDFADPWHFRLAELGDELRKLAKA